MKKVLSVLMALAILLSTLPVGNVATGSEREVTGISVKTQPDQLVYVAGETLSLEGLVVLLSYGDGQQPDVIEVGYEDLPFMADSLVPSHGTVMTAAHNGQPVAISCNGQVAYTANLTVTPAPTGNALLVPPTAVFDKNPPAQTDVTTQIQWGGASYVLDVKKEGASVGTAAYAVSGSTLTIKKEYLASQPADTALELTVEFDVGDSAKLTIVINDTSPVSQAPFWPEGSVLSAPCISHLSITLSWTAAQDDTAVTGYRIQMHRNSVLLDTVETTATTRTFTGLSPGTEYVFWVQALDGDGNVSAVLPLAVRTLQGSAASDLRLSTSRRTIHGSYYTGDTAQIELRAEPGLHPVATVSYREWNAGRTAAEDRTENVPLTASPLDSRQYGANFVLQEGICEITGLSAELSPGVTVNMTYNRKVAGRLKVAVQPPAGLDTGQKAIFDELLRGSGILIKSGGNGTLEAVASNPYTYFVEGPEEAGNGKYELVHYDAQSLVIYKTPVDVQVRNGLTTEFTYQLDSFSHVKVRVVDDLTGQPLEDITVTSQMLTNINSTKVILSAKTGENGYAATTGYYFAKNLRSGSRVEVRAEQHSGDPGGIQGWHEDKIEIIETVGVGENEMVIRMRRADMVTLTGRVTDVSGALLKNIFVSVPQSFGNSPVVNLAAQTGDNGVYTLQVAKMPGTVFFSGSGTLQERQINPADGVNTLDVTMPALTVPTVEVFFEEQYSDGTVKSVELYDGLTVTNQRNKAKGLSVSVPTYRFFSIQGSQGDTVEVVFNNDNDLDLRFARVAETVVLNANNYARVKLVLKPFGLVHARVIDPSGNERFGERRRMTFYRAEGDPQRNERTAWTTAFDPYLSHSLPDGDYKAVLSWGTEAGVTLSDWGGISTCVITESFRVEAGKTVNLGTKSVPYLAGSGYFSPNKGNGLTASHGVALPGTTITLRVSYNYDGAKPITQGKLELAAQIPRGTELVSGNIFSEVTRGSITTQPVIAGNEITLDLKEGITSQGVAGTLIFKVRVKDPPEYTKITSNAAMRFVVGANARTEMLGAVSIPTQLITLNVPPEVAKINMGEPVTLNGFAPPKSTVQIYDGNIKIGEAAASDTGAWKTSVSLPDRGMPIYHSITAKTENGGSEHAGTSLTLVGVDRAVLVGGAITRPGFTTFFTWNGTSKDQYMVFQTKDGLAVFNVTHKKSLTSKPTLLMK